MMTWMRQALRGCRSLPGVGPHPGTAPLVIFTLAAALAGAQAGPIQMVLGTAVMLAFFGPLYLIGAADRAAISDRIRKSQS